MKHALLLTASIGLTLLSQSQTPAQLITQVKKAQQGLTTIYCKTVRHDTLVTGTVRTMTGESRITLLPADTILGFKFWSTKENSNCESIYDGTLTFDIDHTAKTFSSFSTPGMIPSILDSRGHRLSFPILCGWILPLPQSLN